MLNISSDTSVVPHGEFFAVMSLLRRTYVDKEYYLDMLARDKAVLNATERLILEYMSFNAGYEHTRLTKTILRKYLIEVEGVPEHYMQKYDRKRGVYINSMDAAIMNKLIEYNVSPYLMELYEHLQSLEAKYNFARAQVGAMMKTSLVDRHGKELSAIPFYYVVKSTGRVYTNSVSIQSFSHRYDGIHTAPKDYYLVWGDFSQIDLRVALELCLTGEGSLKDNLLLYDDKYKAFANAMNKDMGKEFNPEKFQEDRGKFKEGILAPIYGMGRSAVQHKVNDDEIGGAIHDYINGNDKYKAYKQSVVDNLDSKLNFFCTTYFGTQMPVAQGTGNKYTASLNKPIQGTSSDIMKIVTVEIYNRMLARNKDRNMFIPLVNRHDETIFLVHKSMTEHMHEFLDCTKIQVDDWATLEIEWGAGYVYGEEDPEIMRGIKQTLKAHPATPRKITQRLKPYHATPKLERMNWVVLGYGQYKFSLIQSFFNNKALFTVHDRGVTLEKLYPHIKEHWRSEVAQADRIILYSDKTMYMQDKGKEIISEHVQSVSNYVTERLCKGLASRYMKNVLMQEPVQEWEESGDLTLRKGFDLKCLTEML